MNFKKLIAVIFLALMLILPLVAAYSWEEFRTDITPTYSILFGADKISQMGVTILAFLLIMLVIYGVLSPMKIFGENVGINIAIAAIVSILGTRFLDPKLITTLSAPAGAMVALLVAGIPFIVLFYVIEKLGNEYARRALWAAYAGILLILVGVAWWKETSIWESWYWVYIGIAIACFIAFWFDGTIQKWFSGAGEKRAIAEQTGLSRAEILREIKNVQSELVSAGSDAERKHWKDELKRLQANLDALA